MSEDKDLGATPRRSQEAGSIAPDAAPHVAHTPGPWTFEPWPHEAECLGATLGAQAIIGSDRISPAVVWGGIREAKANAHLIAAAPEMLEAVKQHRLLIGGAADTDSWREYAAMLDALIAKAEGRRATAEGSTPEQPAPTAARDVPP